MTDTAVDEDRDPPFDSSGDVGQDIGSPGHAVEDAAAVVADDDALSTGFGTGDGFFCRHDAFDDEGQFDSLYDFGNITGTLRPDRLAKDAHVDQRRRIDIAGHGKGTGGFGLMGLLDDLVVAAGLDGRNDDARPFLTRRNPRSIHVRRTAVAGKAEGTCFQGRLGDSFVVFLFHFRRVAVDFGIEYDTTDRRQEDRHAQRLAEDRHSRIRVIDAGHAAHDQAVFLEGFDVTHERPARAQAAESGNHADAGLAIALGTDMAALHFFTSFVPYFL